MLTLFEHQTKPFAWNTQSRAALARLNRAQGDDILLPAFTRDGEPAIRATQYVGVIRLGRETIQVLPKIYRQRRECRGRSRAEPAPSAGRRRRPARPRARARAAAAPPCDWFEILTRLFASHLTDAWRRGIVRGYVPSTKTTRPVLRGQWRLADQLRRPDAPPPILPSPSTSSRPTTPEPRPALRRGAPVDPDPRRRQPPRPVHPAGLDGRGDAAPPRHRRRRVRHLPDPPAPVLRPPARPGPAVPGRRLVPTFRRRPRDRSPSSST